MKTKFKSSLRATCLACGAAVCAGALMLISGRAQAQNLFVSGYYTGNIYEYTPGGVQSIFANGGYGDPFGTAFSSSGNLFTANGNAGGNIFEYTPGGAQSTFATGLVTPFGLAFNRAGDLF